MYQLKIGKEGQTIAVTGIGTLTGLNLLMLGLSIQLGCNVVKLLYQI